MISRAKKPRYKFVSQFKEHCRPDLVHVCNSHHNFKGVVVHVLENRDDGTKVIWTTDSN